MNIEHFVENKMFETTIDGLRSYLKYSLSNGVFTVTSTVVDPALRGQNIASELMQSAVAYAEQNGYKIEATCRYAVVWMERNYNK